MKKHFALCMAIILPVCLSFLSLSVNAAPRLMSDGQVFDPEYYAAENPDVVSLTGDDPETLYSHYKNYGIKEGRKPYAQGTDVNTVKAAKPVTVAKGASYAVTDVQYRFRKSSYDNSMILHAVVEIINTGTKNLYLDSAVFDIEDSSGKLLDTEDFISSCPDVIAPGEKGFFYTGMGGISLNSNIKENQTYVLKPDLEITVSEKPPVVYSVSDLSLSSGSLNFPTVTGRVTNPTGEKRSMLYVTAVFYGRDGHVLDLQGTNVWDLKPGETRSFDIPSYYLDDLSDIGSYEVIARPWYYQ